MKFGGRFEHAAREARVHQMRQVAFARFRFHHRAIAIDHEKVAGNLVGNGARKIESPPGHQHNFNSARSRVGNRARVLLGHARPHVHQGAVNVHGNQLDVIDVVRGHSCSVDQSLSRVIPIFRLARRA